MKRIFLLSLIFVVGFWGQINAGEQQKPRVIVMTDGEVDDRCSMVRFLLSTNEVELVAIIQTNSFFQQNGWSSVKWLDEQIDAYEMVYPNLVVHDSCFPTADIIRSKVYVGDEDSLHLVVSNNFAPRVPGTEPVIDPSGWADTKGSDKIVEVLLEEDPRPVYIQAWGGGNTAARAFFKLKSQYPDDYARAISKVVMYNIWYQDGAGNYIEKYHPGVKMLVSRYFNGTWDYGSMAFTHTFVLNDVKNNHGPLGALYAQDYISEGDSPAFLFTLGNGLRGFEDPTWGSWGGRFYKMEGSENVYRDIDKGSYLRWIEYANRDFKTKLDWCVAEKFSEANHRPVIRVAGDLNRTVSSGEHVVLEASVSDPDDPNIDKLWSQYAVLYAQAGLTKDDFINNVKNWPKTKSSWWQYKDAGTYDKMIKIKSMADSKAEFVAPVVDTPQTIHIILEVKDNGAPALTSFARFVINVLPQVKE
ncbi:MAG: hypothetical protein CR996_00975 [Draconibacterium sp.]|nr:MAG: hypothetical protein CR996_00975 [Draconibacterium sp.]PIF06543.1 MAG: hypothetical protein CSA36_00860 [Draconibacterium sp.]